eukprot:scaffold207045_cov31-Tisochrysis_lutea.AAC.3
MKRRAWVVRAQVAWERATAAWLNAPPLHFTAGTATSIPLPAPLEAHGALELGSWPTWRHAQLATVTLLRATRRPRTARAQPEQKPRCKARRHRSPLPPPSSLSHECTTLVGFCRPQ